MESPINSTNISGLNLALGSSTLQHPQQIHPVLIAAFPAQTAHVHAVINPPPAATICRACRIGANILVRHYSQGPNSIRVAVSLSRFVSE